MNQKIETYRLWWINKENQERFPAGVAFREETLGEYRLKVDRYYGKRFFLKDTGSNDGKIYFRLEESAKIRGRNVRVEAGQGFSDEKKPETILIVMAPHFSATLCLELEK